VETFQSFYDARMSQRKLTWVHQLGAVVLNVKYEAKTIEMHMQTPQCSVLLLFRNEKELSMQKIIEKTKMPADAVKRALYSLSCAKYKILNKSPEGKTVNPEDVFSFNEKFTDRSRRIKIALPPPDERKATIENVVQDRRHAIDAAIVRVMKTRKALAYNELVVEVVNQLQQSFLPEAKMIKMRVDDLINKEYIMRDEENSQVFKYIA